MPLDYSKWDHIEISDDEDDTHPNIDTPSLFKWRHEARVQREEERKLKKEALKKDQSRTRENMLSAEERLAKLTDKESDAYKKLEKEVKELKRQEKEFEEKEAALKKEEAMAPHNVDSLSKEVQSKTIISKPKPPPPELTDEEKVDKQLAFAKTHKDIVNTFGMFSKYDDSLEYIEKHKELASEEAANILAIRCIELQVEGKTSLVDHMAHQTIVLQFILELAKHLKADPVSCVGAFFIRIKKKEPQYMAAFNAELESFKQRVRERANVRMEMARKQMEEEERAEREAHLGPGGLDPQEVMESLPEVLQECFKTRDIGMLKEAVEELPKDEAEYHIKRCIDSGLWVPGGAEQPDDGEEEEEEEDAEKSAEKSASGDATSTSEDVYEQVS